MEEKINPNNGGWGFLAQKKKERRPCGRRREEGEEEEKRVEANRNIQGQCAAGVGEQQTNDKRLYFFFHPIPLTKMNFLPLLTENLKN